ncbi:MAG TPA: hypothetical protein DD381_05645 [Lentisphaeria bacterium]|nr:MAG: hypothetical protein A2X47_08455 [Lentisphaerae bacterium GWF2_38_69]HBM15810.1 hypothetical protein [Lentisphaeria bacterium]
MHDFADANLQRSTKSLLWHIELIDVQRYAFAFEWKGIGCKKSLIDKSIYNVKKTRQLIDYLKNFPTFRRLCG